MPFRLYQVLPQFAKCITKRDIQGDNCLVNDEKRTRRFDNEERNEQPNPYVVANDMLRRVHSRHEASEDLSRIGATCSADIGIAEPEDDVCAGRVATDDLIRTLRPRLLDHESRLELPSAYVVANDMLRRLHLEQNVRPTEELSAARSLADDIMGELAREAAAHSGTYAASNGILRRLHSENNLRSTSRLMGSRGFPCDSQPGASDLATSYPFSMSTSTSSTADPLAIRQLDGKTCFTLGDVVACGHGPGGRCLQCAGRAVHNVSLEALSEFSRACPVHVAAAQGGGMLLSHELTFPALVALAHTLQFEPGERMLHLGSGAARSMIAWALSFSNTYLSCVEPRPRLHQIASDSVASLPAKVQGRIWLNCCEPLTVQKHWREASVILVSPTGLAEDTFRGIASGLHDVQLGTRVVSFTRPLCDSGVAHITLGLDFVREVIFRSLTGNVTAYIYRRSASLGEDVHSS